jgi:hypothetical protein
MNPADSTGNGLMAFIQTIGQTAAEIYAAKAAADASRVPPSPGVSTATGTTPKAATAVSSGQIIAGIDNKALMIGGGLAVAGLLLYALSRK